MRNTVNPNKIDYKINGTIINSVNKLVIFEDITNNKTLFLKENEVYNDITIKEIGKKRVALIEANELKEIPLH